jgi:multifunctional methyltransferase subunit TRM112
MRIITHNMLKCNVRGVESGYPLIIEPEKVEIIPCDFNQGEHCMLHFYLQTYP